MTALPAHAIILRNRELTVAVDPRRGAEVFSVVDNDSGSEVMWSTPTRERAEQVLAGTPVVSTDSFANFFAGYRGRLADTVAECRSSAARPWRTGRLPRRGRRVGLDGRRGR